MWSPRGISPKATALPYSLPTYTSRNTSTTTANPLAPHNLLQDPMMSALNPTGIADMVSRQVGQQEKEMDAIPNITKRYPAWVESVLLPPNFRMLHFKMVKGSGNPAPAFGPLHFQYDPVINGFLAVRDGVLLQLLGNHWKEQPLLGIRISQKPPSSAEKTWNKNSSISSTTQKDGSKS